ncbi:hypothetical protein M5689_009635 [Euphorbia peplus]|nr:hypothetical protein M5689_009635 [Euphorbia peplus]
MNKKSVKEVNDLFPEFFAPFPGNFYCSISPRQEPPPLQQFFKLLFALPKSLSPPSSSGSRIVSYLTEDTR